MRVLLDGVELPNQLVEEKWEYCSENTEHNPDQLYAKILNNPDNRNVETPTFTDKTLTRSGVTQVVGRIYRVGFEHKTTRHYAAVDTMEQLADILAANRGIFYLTASDNNGLVMRRSISEAW